MNNASWKAVCHVDWKTGYCAHGHHTTGQVKRGSRNSWVFLCTFIRLKPHCDGKSRCKDQIGRAHRHSSVISSRYAVQSIYKHVLFLNLWNISLDKKARLATYLCPHYALHAFVVLCNAWRMSAEDSCPPSGDTEVAPSGLLGITPSLEQPHCPYIMAALMKQGVKGGGEGCGRGVCHLPRKKVST